MARRSRGPDTPSPQLSRILSALAGRRLAVSTSQSGSIYTRRAAGGAIAAITLPAPFAKAPRSLLAAVARLANDEDSGDDVARIRVFMFDHETPKGACGDGGPHDLTVILERVVARYFRNVRQTPKACPRKVRGKLGWYQRGRITINPRLNDPKVPAYVIEQVMHHEMLHHEMGIAAKRGRLVIHSPEFRRRERTFRQYANATAWLRKHYHALGGGVD